MLLKSILLKISFFQEENLKAFFKQLKKSTSNEEDSCM